MRIVQLNPFFFPYAGGTERRILELGRRLAKDHEVIVLTSQLEGTDATDTMHGVEVRRLPSRFRLGRMWNPPLVRTRGVAQALAQLKPDVVDYHYRWARDYDRAFAGLPRATARAFTYNNSYGEGTGLLRWASLANDAWTAGSIRGSDAILCVSRFIRDDLAARGFPVERLHVVPNGVDAAALRAGAARGTLPDVLHGRRYVAAVGRLVRIKGFDVAIRALPRLPPDIHLAICGEGPQREVLMKAARRAGVGDRVHLLGWVPEDDKLRILREAIAMVHPARFEAFGIAPLEALAVGTPVVATGVGGLVELVHGAGALTARDDADGVAEGIRRFLDVRTRRGASALAKARAQHYDWDGAARSLAETYAALAARRKST